MCSTICDTLTLKMSKNVSTLQLTQDKNIMVLVWPGLLKYIENRNKGLKIQWQWLNWFRILSITVLTNETKHFQDFAWNECSRTYVKGCICLRTILQNHHMLQSTSSRSSKWQWWPRIWGVWAADSSARRPGFESRLVPRNRITCSGRCCPF